MVHVRAAGNFRIDNVMIVIFWGFMKGENFIIVASSDDYLWGSEVVDFQEPLTLIGGADAE